MPRTYFRLPRIIRNLQFNHYCLILALLIGGTLRLLPFGSQFRPLGDGGLFWNITRQIVENHFLPPSAIDYPTLTKSIPFCYPPLAFYIAAIPYTLGISLETIFWLLPFLFSLLLIVCFYRLACTLFKNSISAGATTLLWSLFFNSFSWHIMGGGLTRALGLAFALLFIEAYVRLLRDADKKALWQAGIFLGLTALSHLDRFHFAMITLAVIWLFYGRTRQSALASLQLLVIAFVVFLHWLGLCASRYGFGPFLSAMQTNGDESVLTLLIYLGLIPIATSLFSLRKSLFFVPVWALAITVLAARSGILFLTFPCALGLGAAVETTPPPAYSEKKKIVMSMGILALLSCLVLFTTYETLFINSLDKNQVHAMKWVDEHTSADARFLVVPGRNWAIDLEAEWFPALAQRSSVATVQGAEWLPDREFEKRLNRQEELLGYGTLQEIETWQQRHNIRFNFIYLSETSPNPRNKAMKRIQDDLLASSRWRRIYSNDGAAIFQRQNS